MAVTDLTGTKWLINETPENAWGAPYSISFTSNNENFVALFADPDDLYGNGRGLKYFVTTPQEVTSNEFEHAYNSRTSTWANQAYRTIEITGGTDATNATLISWLQANATQVIEPSVTPSISIGSLSLSDVYVGNTKISKIFLGSTLLWEKEEEPQPTVDPILANNSWDVIKAVCEAGNAADYWSVGDTKTDVGTDGKTRTFRIVDMQGLYGKHVVFEQVEQESRPYVWNPSSNTDDNSAYNNYSITNVSGSIRYALNTTIKALYSSGLQAALTQTTVKVAKNGSSSTILDVTDYLFLPAETEIFFRRSYSRTEEAKVLTQYQWYKPNNTAASSKKLRDGQAKYWWLRSPRSGYTNRVCVVSDSGSANFDLAHYNYGVAPFFSF